MNWYTLRVISGKESKIKENLLFELEFQNLSRVYKMYFIFPIYMRHTEVTLLIRN